MWLTGFDAPCLHTMYADKPMQGYELMQAIKGSSNAEGDTQVGAGEFHREQRPG